MTGLETGWDIAAPRHPYSVLLPMGFSYAAAIAGARGGLLPHHFTLTADAAVSFLLHFPLGRLTPPQPEVIRHRVPM